MDTLLAGNTVQAYLIFIAIVFLSFSGLILLRSFVLKWLQRWVSGTENSLGGFVAEAFGHIRNPFLFAVSLYHGHNYIQTPPAVRRIFDVVILALVVFQAAFLAGHLVASIIRTGLSRGERAVNISAVNNLTLLARFFIWVAALLFLLDNLGIDVKTMLAGLGVGGVAIALAAQSILGDVFSSFTIYIDRPFDVGDVIEINGIRGTVETVGLKTTRIRSLTGEIIVLPNSQLTGNLLRNFQQVQTRRNTLSLGVTYDTSLKDLQRIPDLLQEAARGIDKLTLERSHFRNYGAFSLDFEVVTLVDESDFNPALDRQQSFLFRIKEVFDREGIAFAFPTQTILLNQGPSKT